MLRHSFASRLREAGAPLELICDALGHTSIEVTMIYAHLSTSRQQRDITKYLEG
jgi:site-specific recombinase XerD